MASQLQSAVLLPEKAWGDPPPPSFLSLPTPSTPHPLPTFYLFLAALTP